MNQATTDGVVKNRAVIVEGSYCSESLLYTVAVKWAAMGRCSTGVLNDDVVIVLSARGWRTLKDALKDLKVHSVHDNDFDTFFHQLCAM